MKSNKKIILVFSLLAVVILVFGLISVYQSRINISKLPALPEVKEDKTLILDTEINTKNGTPVMSFSITPKNEKFSMSAFTYKAKVNNNGITDQTKIIKSEKLVGDAWSFPIFRLINLNPKANSIEVEVAGFRLGNTPYFISSKTELFSISLVEDSNPKIDFVLDEENTKFFSSDVVTELLY